MENEIEHVEAIAVSGNALEQSERASIDIQISTAKRFPRSMEQFYKRAEGMVTLDEETARSCLYRRPVGKEGGAMKFAEGESVRLAEIVASSYGNIRVAGRITEMDARFVKAQGVAHDLETNTLYTAEVVESTVNKYGQPFSERMRVVVAKSAQSKAIRDAIFRVIPKSLCKSLVTKAKLVAQGDLKTLDARRKGVLEWVKTLNIDIKRVWKAIGITGPDDIDMNVLLLLAGIKTALDEGDCTVDETFPRPEAEHQTGTTAERIFKAIVKDPPPPPVEEPPKRKRRTKAEIEADAEREAEEDANLDAAIEGPEPSEEEQAPPEEQEAIEEVAPAPTAQWQCERCKRELTQLKGDKCPYCMGGTKEL